MTENRSASGPQRARRGLALLVVSAVAFSSAGFFTRAAPVGVFAMVVWRNLFGGGALLAALSVMPGGIAGRHRRFGPGALSAVVLSAGSMVLYLAAFSATSVADISIIYATAPLMTAAGAWLALRERLARRTPYAAGLALLGVATTVGGSVGTGSAWGDGLAIAMTMCLSAIAIIARGATVPPLETALVSSMLAAVTVLGFSLLGQVPLAVSAAHLAWLGLFGVISMAVALPCYLAGAAAVPATRAMLISTLEMPLAPFSVWLAFGERPATTSVLGGGLVLIGILVELAWPDRATRGTAALADGRKTS